MAKKIIISFSDQPFPGNGFSYDINIEEYPLFYNSGQNSVQANYVPRGSPLVTEFDIERGSDLNETINRTILYLSSKYVSSIINYSRLGNTIEISISSSKYISVNFGDSNVSISTSSVRPSDLENINLKYYFQYINSVNDEYVCNIYQKGYVGNSTEIYGKAIIEKASVKDHLTTLRGTGLSLELEAGLDLTFEDLYGRDERDFTVKLYKNGNVIYRGYVDPEGIYQSFVRDTWILNINCVDGLGSLENLSFVDEGGFHFVGKMKAIDIIYNCLKRTGLLLPLNTSVNTYYEGLSVSDSIDPFSTIKLNADRFVKIDDSTIMSCEEVLNSVLNIFNACVTQENSEWYIYKPNELYDNQYPVFRRYNTNNEYVGVITKNLNNILGSHIDGYYPHHCNGDQKIQIKAAVSSCRINYKYGFIVGLLQNPKLEHPIGSLTYEGWNILDDFFLINNPSSSYGFIFKDVNFDATASMVVSDPFPVVTENLLSLKISAIATLWDGNYGGKFLKFKIKVGSYYLKYSVNGDTAPMSDAETLAEWTLDTSATYRIYIHGDTTATIALPRIPADGNMTIGIVRTEPQLTNKGQTVFNEIDIVPTVSSNYNVGEFHTSSRSTQVSSKAEENSVIYNGDNFGVVYLGGIFKSDGITPTVKWFRKNKYELFPILRIASEEKLRISQKPTKIFSGSIYGFVPYLSVTRINNVNGMFMPISYEFDTFTNVSNIKYLELFSAEIPDILYNFTFDYGNTVKPTIK
jgi:hypothetical protein